MTTIKRKRSNDGSEESSISVNLSTAQVQDLISQEVQNSMEQSDKMMKALIERIQEINNEPRYDARIRKLEAQVRKVKRRGDAVFTDIRKRGLLEPDQSLILTPEAKNGAADSSPNGEISGSSASGDISSKANLTRKPKEGFWRSLLPKKQIVDLTDDGEVCRQNGTTHIDSPQTSSQDTLDSRSSPLEGGEISCLGTMTDKERLDVQEAEAALRSRLPPFPDTPFPHQLPVAAASKSMPQKPIMKVARTQNPQGIALVWNVEEVDPDAAAMDCYYIYVAQERSDGTFSKWKTMGVIKAVRLPMACRLSVGKNADKMLCFLIIGKDVYGRYGPYSDVHTISPGKT
ncbi:activating transcription factor 7-interacting protein 2 [Clarias gariepinus]|uniref:activating transcription factor 7-interacting protein 2 n=1 Tax=Clarias gariepinus TaxID=13013 RepID=UPI00234CCD5E|nr:activating transcription factor 7-interacting protein 2 [Clarias gariepinus]